MNFILRRFTTAVLSLLLIPAFAIAQVNGPGLSDPALFDTVINLPPDPNLAPFGSIGGVAGKTTQLNVLDGGSVGSNFRALAGSEVNIGGGSVGNRFVAYSDSELNISEGSLGDTSTAVSGSILNISGGIVGSAFFALRGSVVNVTGGTVGSSFVAWVGSEVNLSGGSVGNNFNARLNSEVELFGGEFNLNGATFTDSTITLSANDVFTGTLLDGSAFIFSSNGGDQLVGVTLMPATLPIVDTTPIVVNTAFPTRPSGLRIAQTLTLQDGGELGDNFEAVDATLNIEGGSLGAYTGVIRSVVNISGGTVMESFRAESGSEVNISGGTVGQGFGAYSGSVVNISGGTLGSRFVAHSGSEVNLQGTDFLIDGVPLENLVMGEALTITERDVTLSGLLADGTPFDFELNRNFPSRAASFALDATLTVTLVPEPGSLLLGAIASVGVVMRRRRLSYSLCDNADGPNRWPKNVNESSTVIC